MSQVEPISFNVTAQFVWIYWTFGLLHREKEETKLHFCIYRPACCAAGKKNLHLYTSMYIRY